MSSNSAKTQAEQMAERYGDDGRSWVDGDGIRLEAALDADSAQMLCRPHGLRAIFDDGSVLTTAGDGWDIGFPDCDCWRGAGHHRDCGAGALDQVQVTACSVEDLAAVCDLDKEAAALRLAGVVVRAYRVTAPQWAEAAHVLAVPSYGRYGIAHGADAEWTDAKDVDDAVARWLTDRMSP